MKYNILSDGEVVGEIKTKIFSRTYPCNFKGKEYSFVNRGFFKLRTQVTDMSSGNIVGTITFGNWKSKAQISANNKLFDFKFDNFLHTRWSISEEGGTIIQYKGSWRKGVIESELENYILILSGIFIADHYWQQRRVTISH
jgi:hypothetical protein